MHHYRAYDLDIRSSLPLPELKSSKAVTKPALDITYEPVEWALPDPPPAWKYFHRQDQSIYCYWKIIGKFLVRSGTEIAIDPIPDVEVSTLRLPLLGSVLAIALHQRQQLVLHGSAVVIGGKAVLFLGASGQGKSTTAAALYNRGYQLMTDDVAAIDLNRSATPVLLPGFPRIKLWPESVTHALSENPESLTPIHPDVKKVGRSTADSFCQEPMPIERIYVLATGSTSAVKISRLDHQEAVSKLTENAYIPMLLGSQFLQLASQTEKFQHVCQCVSLAQKVPICVLERPHSFDLLPNVISLIEQDLNAKSVPVLV